MKFEEKLITLRKKKLLSQEQLAEKLDVTRQTVSKWELGQSRPDMDKLTNMSKLFNVSIDTLTNSEISIENDEKQVVYDTPSSVNTTKKIKNNVPKRKFILYILIVVFVFSIGLLILRIGNSFVTVVKSQIEETKKEDEEQEKELKEEEEKQKKEEERSKNFEKNRFNYTFEMYQGTESGMFAKSQLDNIIKNNNKSSEHLIEVIFDGVSHGTEVDSIRKMKDQIKEFKNYKFQEYEISLDYGDDGYVNKVTIETK